MDLQRDLPRDIYFSVAIETDGPIPGEGSLLSIALCVAGSFDGHRFYTSDPDGECFEATLEPLAARPAPDLVAVSAADEPCEQLAGNGSRPQAAMPQIIEWIAAASGESRPVLVAYPLGFVWSFSHYYFIRFAGSDPFGSEDALDLKTIYATKAGTRIARSERRAMSDHLGSAAMQDARGVLEIAKGQAEIFQKLMRWYGAL